MGRALSSLLDFPTAKIRWDQVLRGTLTRAVAQHGYDDTSYQRRARRTGLTGPIFPGGVCYRAKVAVVIDTSGSMSDTSLKRCIINTVAISRALRVRIYLVTHDDGVQWRGWLDQRTRPEDIAKRCVGRGGTHFAAAYQAVQAAGAFDACVHLTDGGVEHWPARPERSRKLIVALFGWASKRAIPAGARVIETEVDEVS